MTILKELKRVQFSAYKEKPLIRYIYGRQFNLIYNKINGEKKTKISPFLMFLTNNSIIDEDVNFEYKSTNNIYEDLIKNCETYLNEILKKKDLSLKKIYSENLIVEKFKNIVV